jgi:hypothetical protein
MKSHCPQTGPQVNPRRETKAGGTETLQKKRRKRGRETSERGEEGKHKGRATSSLLPPEAHLGRACLIYLDGNS